MAVVAPNQSRDGHEAGTSDLRRPGFFSLALTCGRLIEPRRRPTKRTKCLGIKRETARPKSMRRGVLISSRGNGTAIELFFGGVRGWEARLRWILSRQ